MKKFNIEMGVGLFLIAGFLCFAYLSIKLGDVSFFGKNTYAVNARFSTVSGLKPGADVELAGVKIGKVSRIHLDGDDYEAIVELDLNNGVKLQEDSIASIKTSGIIGDKYVNITPGGADELIPFDGEIFETESAIDIESLVSKYIFEKE